MRCLVALRRLQAVDEEVARQAARLDAEPLPFEARTIAAQLPLFASPPDALLALEQLRQLAAEVRGRSAGGETSSHGSVMHLLRMLSRAASLAGHGQVAVQEVLQMLPALGEDAAVDLHTALGRHHLAEGHLEAAREAFALAAKHGRAEDSRAAFLDAGLLALGHDQSTQAAEHFRGAAESAASEIEAMPQQPDATSQVVDDVVAAENNLAVCQLHACKLREAVRRLETLVRRDPVLYLRDALARTLSGLYEFLPDAKERRGVLQELVEAFQLDDVDPSACGGAAA